MGKKQDDGIKIMLSKTTGAAIAMGIMLTLRATLIRICMHLSLSSSLAYIYRKLA